MSFSVMGYKVEPVDANVAGTTEGQQTAEPPLEVVYSTDDEKEAQQLVNAGGFINSANEWIVVKEYANDSDVLPRGEISTSISKSAFGVEEGELPNNSNATIDDTGRVKSDDSMHEITEEDVTAMVQADLDVEERAPRKHNIVD